VYLSQLGPCLPFDSVRVSADSRTDLEEDAEKLRVFKAPYVAAGLNDVADGAVALETRTALHHSKAPSVASSVWHQHLERQVSGPELATPEPCLGVLMLIMLAVQHCHISQFEVAD